MSQFGKSTFGVDSTQAQADRFSPTSPFTTATSTSPNPFNSTSTTSNPFAFGGGITPPSLKYKYNLSDMLQPRPIQGDKVIEGMNSKEIEIDSTIPSQPPPPPLPTSHILPPKPLISEEELQAASGTSSSSSSTDTYNQVGLGSSTYSKTKGELNTLINKLTSSGVGLELDIPRICVIGVQSAGKSSLLESISGIKFPKGSGTCTRVPTEMRLHNALPGTVWNCKVSLRFEFNEFGNEIDKIEEIPFGRIILDPLKVEKVLRKAQLAILNPSIHPDTIFTLSDEDLEKITELGQEGIEKILGSEKKSLSFSSNVIVVDIRGENVTDLSFVDLPGVIGAVGESGDVKDIDLIKDLVKRKIKGNSLILLCISMRDDYENQGASLLAREVDPKGERTIGVLTKPDALLPGEGASWIEILSNRRHSLKLSYFCTKQPGPDSISLNPSFEESRASEMKYFEEEKPWCDLDREIKERYGTVKLTAFLSEKLGQYISDKLPELQQRTVTASLQVSHALSRLPPPPSNDPTSELQKIIYDFSQDLSFYSKAITGSESLVQEATKIYDEFKQNIQATKPGFVPSTFEERNSKRPNGSEGLEESEGEIESHFSVKRRRLESILGNQMSNLLVTKDLKGVRAQIAKCRTRELPTNVPYTSKITLMIDSLKSWPLIVDYCLESMRPVVMNLVNKLLQERFGRYNAGPLLSLATSVVRDQIETLFATASERVKWLVSLELSSTSTRNNHYYETTLTETIAAYKKERQGPNVLYDEEKKNAVLATLASYGIPTTEAKIASLLANDIWHEEIDVMAQVIAYWKIAYKRLIDIVPKAIDHEIIAKLSETFIPLQNAVGLGGINAQEQARIMLSENKALVSEREELMKRRARLEEARKALASFGMSSV